MSLLDNLPHTVTITRNRWANDELGGRRPTARTIESGRACWAQPAGARLIQEYRRRDQAVSVVVYFTATRPDLEPGDELVLAGGSPWDGRTLDLVGLNETTAGVGLAWAAACEESRPRHATT